MRPRGFLRVSLVCVVWWTGVQAVGAQSPPEPKPSPPTVQFEAGLGGWISSGSTTWSHDASVVEPRVGNPSSRLEYKDVAVNFIELKGRANLLNRFFLRVAFGFADIGGGRLTDDDFVSAQGAAFFGTTTPGAQRISRTFSDIKGDDSWYGSIEAGGRLLNFPHHRGHLDGFVGYRYWTQRHTATGVAQVECTSPSFCDPVGTISNVRQDAISNEQTWQSLELGLDVEYRLLRRLSLYGSGAFLPLNWLKNDDVHHLRTDLQQDPSFRMTGWGIGANVEAGATVAILSQLFLDVGYRFWWNQVLDGRWENFPVGGGGVDVPLREFRSIRQGLTLGLRYRF